MIKCFYSDLVLPLAPRPRVVGMDHVLEDGALVPEKVGPGQLEAGGLGEALDETVHQVPEICVKFLLAFLWDGGAKTPDDGEDEENLQVDGVHLKHFNINVPLHLCLQMDKSESKVHRRIREATV